NDEQLKAISDRIRPIINELEGKGISVKYDDADNRRPGFKFADYELKGVPVRLAVGARDLENGTIELMRRDTLEKETMPIEGIADHIESLLNDIQANIYKKALGRMNENIHEVNSYDEFKEKIENGGFMLCHWDGTPETEARIKEETKATIRCIPLDREDEEGVCMVTGKPSKRRVIIARSY
ncbi:MAG: proline--tRNA ligase, partial [Muribaculaceae bacterium]|nr:proline--tRNA ligase [Muribaculaceae bacterium]